MIRLACLYQVKRILFPLVVLRLSWPSSLENFRPIDKMPGFLEKLNLNSNDLTFLEASVNLGLDI